MKRLLIIDLSNFIFRAFYGIGPLQNKAGFPTGAIYGVSNMFMTMFKEIKPTHVIIAMDPSGRNDRKDIYEEYKSNRSETPEELKQQIPVVKEMLKLMNFCCIEVAGFEADDVIGTLAEKNKSKFDSIYIASGDKDLAQLVDSNVFVYDSMKNKVFNRKAVFDKFGVYPEQIIDYLSLVGDKSDNVPGVPGIGPKGASNLLGEFSTLENIFQNKESIKSKSLNKKICENEEIAFLSKRLVIIDTDMDLEHDIEQCTLEIKMTDELHSFLEKYELFSTIKKIKAL